MEERRRPRDLVAGRAIIVHMASARELERRRAALIALATAVAMLSVSGTATAAGQGAGIGLYVAGSLADADGERLTDESAVAQILATSLGPGSRGVARIEVAVTPERKPASSHRLECSASCPRSGRLTFTYDVGRFGRGRHEVTIKAVDGAGEFVTRTIVVDTATRRAGQRTAAGPGADRSRTVPQAAFYLTAPDPEGLRRQAYAAAARFARRQDEGRSLLVFDFGAARLKGSTFGTSLRSARFFTNAQIGAALQAAARGHHDHYRRGTATIVYTNSNAKLVNPKRGYRTLNHQRAQRMGRQQARVMRGLHTLPHQKVAVGGDIEPGYDYGANGASTARAMVAGAVDGADGRPYFDVGTAPCNRGGGCGTGWTIEDICSVSSDPGRHPIPEIYLSQQAEQWGAVASRCRIESFPGVSSSPIAGLTPPQSRRLLRVETNATVGDPLIVWPG
jgi:hypothetical protein